MAQNEMRAKRGLPVEVRSMEGLGVIAESDTWLSAAVGVPH